MKKIKNIHWTTIVESIVVMFIIVIWVTWTYSIYTKSQNLINTTKNRLIATQIAREWIEAVMNIRDTNWKILWANTANCWMTKNYDSNCITNNNKNFTSWSYIAYIWPNNRWYLTQTTTWNFSNPTYRNTHKINLDSNWLYTQSWWISMKNPLYTREIRLTPYWWIPPTKYKVESIVRWTDSSKNSWNFEIKLETELTNWKK